MDYRAATRNFRLNCVVRVITLGATFALLALVWPQRTYFTMALLGALAVWQTWSLVRYVEYTNRSLAQFLRFIDFRNFSSRVASGPSGRSFTDLQEVFNGILDRFREMDADREEHRQYLMAMIQHVGVGVLVHDRNGEVALMNHAARRLLDLPRLGNIADLAAVSPELLAALQDQAPGAPVLVSLSVGGELRQLSVHTTELRQRHQTLSLVSMQNISPELNEKEMDAWHNLIRVLTHEIKNSLTPIASLAGSVEQMALDGEKIRGAMQVIQKRSEGLLQFVDSYRDLADIPSPNVSVIPVAELLSRVESLVAPQLTGQATATEQPARLDSLIDPPTMKLTCDPQLIEQVLINLVLNAIDATSGQADRSIQLRARFDDHSRPVIDVIDNGPGIATDSLEQVFVPFYSTKPEGTGIGLSWSRQILRLHHGDLSVTSPPGGNTVFSLLF